MDKVKIVCSTGAIYNRIYIKYSDNGTSWNDYYANYSEHCSSDPILTDYDLDISDHEYFTIILQQGRPSQNAPIEVWGFTLTK